MYAADLNEVWVQLGSDVDLKVQEKSLGAKLKVHTVEVQC